MRVTVHHRIPADEKLRSQWNELALNMEDPQVFYTYEWARAAAQAFAATLRPLLITIYEGEVLIGLAALATSSTNSRQAVFLGASTADYCDLISDVSNRTAVAAHVLSELRRMKITNLVAANVPADSVTAQIMSLTAAPHGFHCYQRTAYRCGRVLFGTNETRSRLRQELHKKKSLQRTSQFLSREGQLEIEHLSAWQDVQSVLPTFLSTHIARFQLNGRKSPLEKSERRDFLKLLAEMLCMQGWFRLSVLRCDGKPIAWHYGFQFAGTWFWYLPTFDSGFAKYSPGLCLLSRVLKNALDSADVHTFDLGLGDEIYKHRFANAQRSTLEFKLSGSLGRHVRNISRDLAVRSVRAVPGLEGQIRKGRDRMVSLFS